MTILAHEKQILEYEKTMQQLRDQNKDGALCTDAQLKKLEAKVEQLKRKAYSSLTPWERVAICRHNQRPHTLDYIKGMCTDFVPLAGDRLFRDDRSIIAGFARIGDERLMLIGQEKGNDTESRLRHNFGMPHPEGYRKALRCMQLAEKFQLPIITLLDTPGAYPGLAAEERGQGWAIAQNLWKMARLATQIIVIVIGEGCSGGALGIGVGDVIGMLEHSYYSVISPEGCASILWKDAAKNAEAAATLKMQAENLLELGIIDVILGEPLGGAHRDPAAMYKSVQKFISEQLTALRRYSIEALLEQRYHKFRSMGQVLSHDQEIHS